MKLHKSILLLSALLVMQGAFAQKSRVSLSDNFPSASEKLKISYSSAGAVLAGKKDISAQVFFIDGKDFPVADVDLKVSGQLLEGEFEIPAGAKAFCIKIFSGADIDNNNDKGYIFPVYKNKKPVAGAYESEGFILTGPVVAGFAKIKTDYDAAIALYKQEHDVYPEGEKIYEHNYYYLMGHKPDLYEAILTDKVKSLKKSNKEGDLVLAASIYTWLGEKMSADSLNNEIKIKFLKGESVTSEAIYTMLRENEVRKKDSLYMDFMMKYPDNKKPDLDFIRTEIAGDYLRAGNHEAFKKYEALIEDKSNLADMFNNAAYDWAEKGKKLDVAEKLSKQSLEIMLEKQKHPRPMPFYSPRAMDKLYKDLYYEYADSYAFILYRQKRFSEALKYQKEVYAHKNDRQAIIEHYVLTLNKLSKYNETKTVIEAFLKTNKSNDVLYNELKEAYVAINKSEAGFNDYFDAASKQNMN
jgi:tetratricopeptide (TPR) repeat protein